MNGNALYAALGAAIGAAALIVGIYFWLSRRRLEEERQLRERLGDLASGASSGSADRNSILRQEGPSNSILDRALTGKALSATIDEDIRLSGLGWSSGQFAGYVVAGLVFGVLIGTLIGGLFAVVLGIMGALLPFAYLSNRKAAREKMIESQLPDAVDMLVNSIRAGYSLQAGMSFVGSELPAPVGTEFSRFYDEQRLGIDVRQALQGLNDRLGTLDSRMFVLALVIQRETGGNLSEILGNIATVIRERIQFKGQLEVLTAESKASAIVLTALPILLFFVIRVTNPTYIAQLTGTETGRLLMAYAFVSLVVGFVILRKMSKIEV